MSAFRSYSYLARALGVLLIAICCQFAYSQSEDPTNNETDPVKLFERGQISASIHHGLTPTYGVGTISETTTFNAYGNYSITEKLTGIASFDFPLYDSNGGTFKTLSASAGVQYPWNSWLASTLFYNYRMSEASTSAARNSDGLLQAGRVTANSGYLTLTAYFDIYPNPGLSRSLTSQKLSPLIRTPFPTAAPAPSSNSPGGTTPAPSSTPSSTP